MFGVDVGRCLAYWSTSRIIWEWWKMAKGGCFSWHCVHWCMQKGWFSTRNNYSNSVGPWIFKLHKESTRFFFLHLIMWTYGLASQLHTQLGMSWWAFQLSTVERIGIHSFANISSSSTCLGLVQFPQNYVFYVFFSFLQFWGDADLSQIIPTGPLRVVSCCAGVSRRGTT